MHFTAVEPLQCACTCDLSDDTRSTVQIVLWEHGQLSLTVRSSHPALPSSDVGDPPGHRSTGQASFEIQNPCEWQEQD